MARIPVLIVNFKTYEKATGRYAIRLAQLCEEVARELDVNIMVAVQPTDIFEVSHSVSIPVLSQHIDSIYYGSHTGYILPEAVKAAGAYGTLINHSEHRLRIDILDLTIKRAKEVGLFTVVCANDVDQGNAVGEFMPDLIAIEPPELIGGNLSVSKAKPELIKRAVEEINSATINNRIRKLNRVIVGAGIKTKGDVRTSIKLGAVGVLVASGVTKAKDPRKELYELAKGLIHQQK